MSDGAGCLETKGAICDSFSPLWEGGLFRADWRYWRKTQGFHFKPNMI
ncbi:hypothetical protein ANACAC_01713 [Anaerostipes caccae L1-92]|uniref:Uncharacterized protein n=1 Tax=Anaerostipes caccae (strain DSM 14662 / CCUG 47493 / JCM 13470 / NCIMB 13811 / L1-92) TaxID=411490 RepID=B0MDS0_ANACD|nr:hypothetical protein ANACAC_01713 [Anaerostipes caccae L1-92]